MSPIAINRRQLLGSVAAVGLLPRASGAARNPCVESELQAAAATLEAERKLARAAGIPLSPEDLRWKLAPPEQDAAPLYAELEKMSMGPPGGGADPQRHHLRRTANGKADEVTKSLCRRGLEGPWAPKLALARRIAARSRCTFDLKWEQVPRLEFPPHLTILETAELLAAQAVVEHDAGRWEVALSHLREAAQIQRHGGETSMGVALVVPVSVAMMLSGAFVHLLKQNAADGNRLRRTAETQRALTFAPDLKHHLTGEVLFSLVGCRNARAELLEQEFDIRTDAEKRADRRMAEHPAPLLAAAFEARVLSFYRRLFDVLDEPADGDAGIRAVRSLIKREIGQSADSYRFSRHAATWAESYRLTALRCIANHQLCAAAVAVMEHRRETDAFPERMPREILDPFDGMPLRYRKRREGCVIYSVGPNLKDDNGASESDDGTVLDLVIELS